MDSVQTASSGETRISRVIRTSLTGRDNQSFDIARIGFALILFAWFLSVIVFLVIQVLHFHAKGEMEGFPAGIAVLFGTLTAVMPCASWAVSIKAGGGTQAPGENQGSS